MNAVAIATFKNGKCAVYKADTCLGAIDRLYSAIDDVSGDVGLIVKVELFTRFAPADRFSESAIYAKLQERGLHDALA